MMRRPAGIPARAVSRQLAAMLVAIPLHAQSAPDACRPPDSRIALDHVVIAVRDLDSAEADLRSLGFTLKPGRLHPNGLRNSHIKFADRTALELMSIERESDDPLTEVYEAFLQAGEGGAFVAIRADPDRVARAAADLDLPTEVTRSGPFTWVTVDDSRRSPGSRSSPVFFISYAETVTDPDSVLVHQVGASGVHSVQLDATRDLAGLLSRLGAGVCPIDSAGESKSTVVAGLQNADLVLSVHEGQWAGRPAVRQVTLYGAPRTPALRPEIMDEQRTHGIRIRLDANE